MKKGFYAAVLTCFCMVFGMAGCSEKKVPDVRQEAVDTLAADTVPADTLSELLEEQPMPTAADELFDDFIFNFAGNRKLQMKRILFPLHLTKDGQVSSIQKSSWRVEHFFMEQNFYTLILDSRKQLNLSKDTSVNHAVVERINLEKGRVKRFCFDRMKGEWKLVSIADESLQQNANASFLTFYQHFATDSAFQMRSLGETVAFTGPNPDDDFEELEGDITPEQWPAFAPSDLPSGLIYNIIYGKEFEQGNKKIFLLRGIANGQELEMTFKHVGDDWKLTRLVE